MNDYLCHLFQLNGKVAAIIGGGGYLCGEMALALAQAGVKVAILDKNLAKAEEVAAKIKKLGQEACAHAVEATDKASIEEGMQGIIAQHGQVDILINGTVFNAPTPFLEIPPDEWNKILEMTLTATMLACQIFGRHMLERKTGSIINMSSVSAYVPLSKAFAYSVAKAGVKNLTQNLAREWAGRGVRINALRPGFFPTEWSKKHFIDEARNKAILGHTPMGRYGRPDELVGAVLWLASDASSFVTGAEIPIDGGFTAMTI